MQRPRTDAICMSDNDYVLGKQAFLCTWQARMGSHWRCLWVQRWTHLHHPSQGSRTIKQWFVLVDCLHSSWLAAKMGSLLVTMASVSKWRRGLIIINIVIILSDFISLFPTFFEGATSWPTASTSPSYYVSSCWWRSLGATSWPTAGTSRTREAVSCLCLSKDTISRSPSSYSPLSYPSSSSPSSSSSSSLSLLSAHTWTLNKDAILKIFLIFKIVIIRTDDRFLQSHRSVQQPTSLSLFLLRSIPTKMMTTAMVKTIKALARPRDVGSFRHVLCVLCTHVQIKMAYLHCEQTQHFISSCWIASIMLQRFEVTVA